MRQVGSTSQRRPITSVQPPPSLTMSQYTSMVPSGPVAPSGSIQYFPFGSLLSVSASLISLHDEGVRVSGASAGRETSSPFSTLSDPPIFTLGAVASALSTSALK